MAGVSWVENEMMGEGFCMHGQVRSENKIQHKSSGGSYGLPGMLCHALL